jgi:peptidoglycan L-alanyl-D-glutamate endopeptidase CwlK
MFNLSKRSLGRLEGIQPILIDILKAAIVDSPYDFGIPQFGGLRTAEDQNMLYQKGRDLPGKIVTNVDGYNKLSNHQPKEGEVLGNAFDIYAYVERKASWKKVHLEAIAEHIKKVALDEFCVVLTWGGDWTRFRDLPHYQL